MKLQDDDKLVGLVKSKILEHSLDDSENPFLSDIVIEFKAKEILMLVEFYLNYTNKEITDEQTSMGNISFNNN